MAAEDGLQFTGRLAVPNDPTSLSRVGKYGQTYYKVYLARILGATLAQTVIDDIGSNTFPTNVELLALYSPFQYDGDNGDLVVSQGIALIISGFVYWEYMKDGKVTPSQSTGTAQTKAEVKTSSVVPETQIYERYNEAVAGAEAVRKFALKNAADYPTFKGQHFLLNYPL